LQIPTDNTILIFDSGIGGLSVIREVRVLLPEYRFVYVGDDMGFPYGEWDEPGLIQRILDLYHHLMDRFNPVLSIVACNTASTLIMSSLRKHYDIPFVGIVPAIKPAAQRTASGLFSVLATPGTTRRRYTQLLVEQFAGHHDVSLVGATRLARMAEDHMQCKPIDTALLREEILPCFIEKAGKRTDIITLGCTHYPFLVNEMRKVAPWPVDWLDPAEAVARRALSLIQVTPTFVAQQVTSPYAGNTILECRDVAVMTSGNPPAPIDRLLHAFGFEREVLDLPPLRR